MENTRLFIISSKFPFTAKIKSFIPVLILLSIMLTSCSPSPYAYTYPKEYSAEYCFGQYELFDPNIVYTECYEFASKKDYGGILFDTNFSAIKDCDDLSFMVYYRKEYWMGSHYDIKVVRNRDSDINPITDFTISSVELFWCNIPYAYTYSQRPEFNVKYDKDEFCNYGSHYMSQTVTIVDSEEAIDEIMDVAVKNTVISYDSFPKETTDEIDENDRTDNQLRCIHCDNMTLNVKISFKECSGLVFVGQIGIDENNRSYMEHIVYLAKPFQDLQDATKLSPGYDECSTYRYYYRLGENMDAFIQPIIASLETNPVS